MKRRRVSPGDSERIAIEIMRRRWEAARVGCVDVEALKAAMREHFPPESSPSVLQLENFPGCARIYATVNGERLDIYAFEVEHVAEFAAGSTRVSWPT